MPTGPFHWDLRLPARRKFSLLDSRKECYGEHYHSRTSVKLLKTGRIAVSDALLPNIGTSDDVDETIQRQWDRFAMLDLSIDPEPDDPAPSLLARSSSDVATATGEVDSLRAHKFTIALGEAFARAKSTHQSDEDTNATHDRGTSR